MVVRIKAVDHDDAVRLAAEIKAANGGTFTGVSTDSGEDALVFIVAEELADVLLGVMPPAPEAAHEPSAEESPANDVSEATTPAVAAQPKSKPTKKRSKKS